MSLSFSFGEPLLHQRQRNQIINHNKTTSNKTRDNGVPCICKQECCLQGIKSSKSDIIKVYVNSCRSVGRTWVSLFTRDNIGWRRRRIFRLLQGICTRFYAPSAPIHTSGITNSFQSQQIVHLSHCFQYKFDRQKLRWTL